MNCQQTSEHIIDYIDLKLDNQINKEIETHISDCDNCKRAYDEMQKLNAEIQQKKEEKPDRNMLLDFMQLIEEEKDKELKRQSPNLIQLRIPNRKILWQTAAAITLLITGFLSGYQFNNNSDKTIAAEQFTEMKNDVNEMKSMLVFKLLENESASQRIKAVNYSEEIPLPDDKIIKVLINTLNSDKNTNVRLAAVYSLSRFKTNKMVINAFVETLNKQDDPMVQIVIINLLVEIQELKAIDEFNDLLKKEDLNEEVKNQIELGIKVLS